MVCYATSSQRNNVLLLHAHALPICFPLEKKKYVLEVFIEFDFFFFTSEMLN